MLLYLHKKSNISEIEAKSAVKLINDKRYVFLDVRTDSEFINGHIKNSYHIPLQKLENRIKEVEKIKDKKIIIYCRSGARSSKATKLLSEKGYHVKNLIGGINSWGGDILEQ